MARGVRRGVPDGWTRSKVEAIFAQALEEAKELVKEMERKGKVTLDEKDEFARAALETSVAMLGAVTPIKDRLAAARLILEYTMEKPATKAEHTINKAEDFLNSLAEGMDKD